MNHYEILEVSPNASAPVIRAAYKSLMQRYHPDKNPGDTAVAGRASLVVQAYEVLSDGDKRAAYDLALREQAENRPPPYRHRSDRASLATGRSSERDRRYLWWLGLLVAVIILSGWSITSLLKPRPAPAAQLPAVLAGPPASPARSEPGIAKNPGETRLLVLATQFSVKLKSPGRRSPGTGRELYIPTLVVKVGVRDAEHALRHLENTQDLILQKLQEDLAQAEFEDLIKLDGEQYLARMILDAIGEISGTGKTAGVPSADADSSARYGVVEVQLPESFLVR